MTSKVGFKVQFSNVQMTSVQAESKVVVFARHTVTSVLRRLDSSRNGTCVKTRRKGWSGIAELNIAPTAAESRAPGDYGRLYLNTLLLQR